MYYYKILPVRLQGKFEIDHSCGWVKRVYNHEEHRPGLLQLSQWSSFSNSEIQSLHLAVVVYLNWPYQPIINVQDFCIGCEHIKPAPSWRNYFPLAAITGVRWGDTTRISHFSHADEYGRYRDICLRSIWCAQPQIACILYSTSSSRGDCLPVILNHFSS